LGPEGRRFESFHPDYRKALVSFVTPRFFFRFRCDRAVVLGRFDKAT
jgi:hypothetical protein